MSGATHAVLAQFSLDPSRQSDQERGLRQMILPGVRHAPGFVSGIWTRTSDGTGSTVVVAFTSGEAATDFLRSVNGNAEGQAAVGMTLDEATVVSVMAEA